MTGSPSQIPLKTLVRTFGTGIIGLWDSSISPIKFYTGEVFERDLRRRFWSEGIELKDTWRLQAAFLLLLWFCSELLMKWSDIWSMKKIYWTKKLLFPQLICIFAVGVLSLGNQNNLLLKTQTSLELPNNFHLLWPCLNKEIRKLSAYSNCNSEEKLQADSSHYDIISENWIVL